MLFRVAVLPMPQIKRQNTTDSKYVSMCLHVGNIHLRVFHNKNNTNTCCAWISSFRETGIPCCDIQLRQGVSAALGILCYLVMCLFKTT